MPHAILKEKEGYSLEESLKKFQAFEEITESWRIKVREFYLEKKGLYALLAVVVVEEGHSQTFYIKLSKSNRKISVRLDSETDPVKTRGVKRSIALVAEYLLQNESRIDLERHNLEGYFTFEGEYKTKKPT